VSILHTVIQSIRVSTGRVRRQGCHERRRSCQADEQSMLSRVCRYSMPLSRRSCKFYKKRCECCIC
jgi:hypothetical protein